MVTFRVFKQLSLLFGKMQTIRGIEQLVLIGEIHAEGGLSGTTLATVSVSFR